MAVSKLPPSPPCFEELGTAAKWPIFFIGVGILLANTHSIYLHLPVTFLCDVVSIIRSACRICGRKIRSSNPLVQLRPVASFHCGSLVEELKGFVLHLLTSHATRHHDRPCKKSTIFGVDFFTLKYEF